MTSLHQKQRAAISARRTAIYDFVFAQDEPVTRDEIAHGISANSGTISKDLRYLLAEGFIAGRQETEKERRLRLGGETRAMAAMLYFGSNPVPERTQRVVVPGVKAECNVSGRRYSSNEVNQRLAAAFEKRTKNWVFTADTLAKRSGLLEGTVYTRLRKLAEDGLVTRAGTTNGRAAYRAVDRDALFKALDYQREAKYEVTVPAPPPVAAPEPVQPLAEVEADTVTLPKSELRDLLELLASQKRQIEAFEAREADRPKVTSIADTLNQYR